MIEIIEEKTIDLPGIVSNRVARVIITNAGQSYEWNVGGLPVEGDLQAILEAREAELWAAASGRGRAVNLYGVTPERLVKALALVLLDEINTLRARAGLQARTAEQVEAAIKARLRG